MAKVRNDNALSQNPRRERWKRPSEGLVRLAILVGVAALIAIAGMNLYETRRQRIELNDRMGQLVTAINLKPASPAATPRSNKPDPDKVYTVKTEGAPSVGLAGAPITIAEFSDFQ